MSNPLLTINSKPGDTVNYSGQSLVVADVVPDQQHAGWKHFKLTTPGGEFWASVPVEGGLAIVEPDPQSSITAPWTLHVEWQGQLLIIEPGQPIPDGAIELTPREYFNQKMDLYLSTRPSGSCSTQTN